MHKHTQVKFSIPVELKKKIDAKADQYGMTFSSYIRHLALNDVEDDFPYEKLLPMVNASKKQKDSAIVVENIDEFFDKL